MTELSTEMFLFGLIIALVIIFSGIACIALILSICNWMCIRTTQNVDLEKDEEMELQPLVDH